MSNNNQNKAGYKHTALGWIPAEWQVELLDKVAKRGSGHTPDKSYESYYNGGIKWVSLADSFRLDKGYIDETEIEVSLDGIKNSSAVIHPAETVLLSRDAGVGKSAVMKTDMAVSQHFITWTCNGSLDNWFLYYWLQLKKEFFERQAVGSTIKTIGLGLFKKLKVVRPSYSEQRKIAVVLSTWDKAITKTQQLIAQLKQRNNGLMQQLLTAKENWKEFRIGELLKEVKRPVSWNDEELYHLISVRRRSGGAFFRESLYGKQILTKQLFTAEAGDFLFSKMQIVHGASAVVPPGFAGMKISGSYIAVHAKDENVMDINFFNWLSKTKQFYRLTYISSYGVHIEKMTFDFDDFKRRKIMLPPKVEVQKSIVEILETAANEVKLQEQKLAALQQEKKGLMQKLLTGEVRVLIDNQ
jgi:type I restriction enzyme, S subunit